MKTKTGLGDIIDVLPMDVDLSEEGLRMLFKDYEELMLTYLWNNGNGTSGELWRHVNVQLFGDKDTRDSISRASVILAANNFVDLGILSYQMKSGKGGYHRVYTPVMNEKQIWEALRTTAIMKMVKASGDIKLFDGKWEALF